MREEGMVAHHHATLHIRAATLCLIDSSKDFPENEVKGKGQQAEVADPHNHLNAQGEASRQILREARMHMCSS